MKCRGEWSSLLTVTEQVTGTSAGNAHSELFINISDRSLKPWSHCMFYPPSALIMLLLSEQLAQMLRGDPMCTPCDTKTSLLIALVHQRLHTHIHTEAQRGTSAHLSQTGVYSSLRATPIQGSFWLVEALPWVGAVSHSRHGNGLPWELCIKHTVQWSHKGLLWYIQYLSCMAAPYGCPL